MQVKSIGLDLGKTTFHLVALGTRSQVLLSWRGGGSKRFQFCGNSACGEVGD
jgi:hypothetical protein